MSTRIRGLKDLVIDAVDNGSTAIEKLQKETVQLPFNVLAEVAPKGVPVRGIQEIYEASVSGTHAVIRMVNRVVGQTLDVVIDAVEAKEDKKDDKKEP